MPLGMKKKGVTYSNPLSFRFRRRTSSSLSNSSRKELDENSVATETSSSCVDEQTMDPIVVGSSLGTVSTSSSSSTLVELANEQTEETDLTKTTTTTTTRSNSVTVVSSRKLTYPSSQNLQQAMMDWHDSLERLARSPEFQRAVGSSVHLAGTAADMVVQGALFFPVTVPSHVIGRTCSMVQLLSHYAYAQASSLLSGSHPRALEGDSSSSNTDNNNDRYSSEDESNADTHQDGSSSGHEGGSGSLSLLFSLPPRMLVGAANKLKDEIGSAVTHVVGMQASAPTPRKRDDFLDRLRLDYVEPEDVTSSSKQQPLKSILKKSSTQERGFSEFLLRVEDLDLGTYMENGKHSPIFFIDLSDEKTTSDALDQKKALCTVALDRLVEQALIFITSGGQHKVHPAPHRSPPIKWKPECSTAKWFRKLTKSSRKERVELLQKETLIWSGDQKGCRIPFFMARGIIPTPPHQVLHQLWENTRTTEYNNFCQGRKTLLELEENELFHGSSRGTKVVQSETRVPFTGLSVSMSCLMHARPLPEGNGFLIVSRSLQSGVAGTSGKSQQSKSGNEILWGLNVLRPVPDHPHLTDLTSLSQVDSASVPRFLAHKIAIMGVEDFFKNIRQHNKKLVPSL